jgi:hypothetical protein
MQFLKWIGRNDVMAKDKHSASEHHHQAAAHHYAAAA